MQSQPGSINQAVGKCRESPGGNEATRGFDLLQVTDAEEFNKFQCLVSQVATRRSSPIRGRKDGVSWPTLLVLIGEFKQTTVEIFSKRGVSIENLACILQTDLIL